MKKHSVGIDRRGVWFSIGQQKFRLHVEEDPPHPLRERWEWYAQQLRIALAGPDLAWAAAVRESQHGITHHENCPCKALNALMEDK